MMKEQPMRISGLSRLAAVAARAVVLATIVPWLAVTPAAHAGPAAFDATYSSGDISVPIPAIGVATSTITVPDDAVIQDVKVSVRISHPFVTDLVVSLVAPDGTRVDLSNHNGLETGGGSDYGSGPGSCSGNFATFDDAAPAQISTVDPPFVGTFTPELPLATLVKKRAAGTWTLQVADENTGDSGTINCWKLNIVRETAVVVCAPRPPVNVATVRMGDGRVQATLQASGAGNSIRALHLGTSTRSLTNAQVDVLNGPSGITGNRDVSVPSGAANVVLFVRPTSPGQAATVPLIVTDACGPWETLVGVGTAG
jgi:subtilisin-like proprotein convertase family protein